MRYEIVSRMVYHGAWSLACRYYSLCGYDAHNSTPPYGNFVAGARPEHYYITPNGIHIRAYRPTRDRVWDRYVQANNL